jgi:hypothetical protein
VVQVDEVPGLLAPEVEPALEHRLEHVAVPDLGLHDLDPEPVHRPLEAQVRHDGGGDRVVLERAVVVAVAGQHGQDHVAVDLRPLVGGGDQPVRVAVVADAGVRAVDGHRVAHHLRVGAPGVLVDVGPVRGAVERHDVRPELAVDLGCDVRGGTVGTVDDDPEPAEIHVGDAD